MLAVSIRHINGEFTVPLFQPHAYPFPGVATRPVLTTDTRRIGSVMFISVSSRNVPQQRSSLCGIGRGDRVAPVMAGVAWPSGESRPRYDR